MIRVIHKTNSNQKTESNFPHNFTSNLAFYFNNNYNFTCNIFTVVNAFILYFTFCWGTWLCKIASGVCKKSDFREVTPLV